MAKKRKSNDDKSMSKNSNNPAYKASIDNRSNQLNPNSPKYKRKSRD